MGLGCKDKRDCMAYGCKDPALCAPNRASGHLQNSMASERMEPKELGEARVKFVGISHAILDGWKKGLLSDRLAIEMIANEAEKEAAAFKAWASYYQSPGA